MSKPKKETGYWSRGRELNSRPADYESACFVPQGVCFEYSGVQLGDSLDVEPRVGIEPTTCRLRIDCTAVVLPRPERRIVSLLVFTMACWVVKTWSAADTAARFQGKSSSIRLIGGRIASAKFCLYYSL